MARRIGWALAVLVTTYVLGYFVPRFGLTSIFGLPFSVMEPMVTITPALVLPVYWEAFCRFSTQRFATQLAIGMLRIMLIYVPIVAFSQWAGPLGYRSYAIGIACGCVGLVLSDWLSHRLRTKRKPEVSRDSRTDVGGLNTLSKL